MSFGICTVDLGFGDGGKGATVDYLCRKYKADLVMRYSGGFQAAHNVVTPEGESHTFAQFGSGTLAGVPTFVGPDVIVNIGNLKREGAHLLGLKSCPGNVFNMITLHDQSRVGTQMAQVLNQFCERQRAAVSHESVHGSTGVGIGITRALPDDITLRVADLRSPTRRCAKLVAIFDYLADFQNTAVRNQDFNSCVYLPGQVIPHETYAGFVRQLRAAFNVDVEQSKQDCDFIRDARLQIISAPFPTGGYNRIVFEAAQGMLIDQKYGYSSHCTFSDVSPNTLLRSYFQPSQALHRFADKLHILGITRAYMVRHGAGPLPTEMLNGEDLNSWNITPTDLHNTPGEFSGQPRYGFFDNNLIASSRCVCESICEKWLDNPPTYSLAVNHWDHVTFPVVIRYNRDGVIYPRIPWGYATQRDNLRITSRQNFLDTIGASVGGPVWQTTVCGYGPTHQDRETLTELNVE